MTVVVLNGCVLFPHSRAWRSKPTAKRVWQTGIEQAATAGEQRSALRAVARRSVSVEFQVRDSERARLEARVDAASKSGFGALPLFGRGSYLTTAANSGASALTVTTNAWNWQAGDYAALLGADDTVYDVVAVTNVTGPTLTLASPLTFSWANNWCVRPMIFGAFTAEKQTIVTAAYAAWRITVAELTSRRSAQIGATPASAVGVGQQVIGSTNLIA